MIPDRVVEVLRGPAFMHVGTRDAELRPRPCASAGGRHRERRPADGHVLRTRDGYRKDAATILATTGAWHFAVGLVSHEAYQLKGTYASSRPADEHELAFQEAHLAKLGAALRQVFPEEFATALIRAIAYRPSVAITFRVEEVFLQTPGPGAGSKMA